MVFDKYYGTDDSSWDPRNADNKIDFYEQMHNLQADHMDGVNGITYEHIITKERRIGNFRDTTKRTIYFRGDDKPYDGNDWQVAFTSK